MLPAALALALAAQGWAAPFREKKVELLRLPSASNVGGPKIEVAAGEALVRFDDTATSEAKLAGLMAAGMELAQDLGSAEWHLVYLPAGMPVLTGVSVLNGLPGVASAVINRLYRMSRLPNDQHVPNQYHLSNVNAFAGWEWETGATNDVIIAVMDTGIEASHPDLSAKMIANRSVDCTGANCVVEDPPVVVCNHGTRVAGVAAASANNGTGVAGMSWGARLVSLRVFPNPCANCSCISSDQAILNAINYVNDTLRPAFHNRIIVNMSLGASGPCTVGAAPLITADFPAKINDGHANGISFVAATGNDGASAVDNPANCPNVIPVGATDVNNQVATFSNRGPELGSRGLVAPGVSLVTTDVNASYTSQATGTSFSSPLVAGLAALIRSAKPAFTPDQVRDTLRNSASNIGVSALQLGEGVHPFGNTAGAGQANAYSAMRLAVRGTTEFDGTQKAIAFPNPFKPGTHGTASVTIPTSLQGANSAIKVYTLTGQHIKTLKGLTWDGKNEDGKPVATGTYVFLVTTDKGATTGRVALIR